MPKNYQPFYIIYTGFKRATRSFWSYALCGRIAYQKLKKHMLLFKTVEYSIKINNHWLCWLKHKLTLNIDAAQCI